MKRLHPFKFTILKDGKKEYYYGTKKGLKSYGYDKILKTQQNVQDGTTTRSVQTNVKMLPKMLKQ